MQKLLLEIEDAVHEAKFAAALAVISTVSYVTFCGVKASQRN